MESGNLGSWLSLVGVVIVWIIYKYLTWNDDFWKKKGIPYIKPSLIFGNVKDGILGKRPLGEVIQDLYWKLDGHKFGGIFKFRKPTLLVRDPELIKTILVREFSSFHDNDIHVDDNVDPMFARNPFVETGERWKATRTQLVPAFTPLKLKPLFPFVTEVCEDLKECVEKNSSGEFETKELCSRFTTDVVTSCAFGVNGNALKNPNSEFREMGRDMLQPTFFSNLKLMIVFIMPQIASIFKIRFFSKKFEEFFKRIANEVVKYREENNVTRKDYLQHLVNLKNKRTVSENNGYKAMPEKSIFTDTDIAAQAITFFADGSETSASALNFTLYSLATNPDVQSRVREEVKAILHKYGGQLSFDAVQEMTYLDMVLLETLRMYPPIMFLTRLCTKPYKLESSPGSNYQIEVGTPVIIPLYAIHFDPQYFPNPREFNPERFTEENKKNRHRYVHLPFGEGPRICLGFRFGLMQVKAGIATIISNYEVRPTARTQIPLVFDPICLFTSPKDGVWLKFCKIK